MAKPNLSQIELQLKSGHNFSLTEEQYLQTTGTTIPRNPSYLKTRSAIARLAKQYGYQVKKQVHITVVLFEKEPSA